MINVDMEMDAVGEVVGGGEGAEAARERIQAVEGKDFDNEGEIDGIGNPSVRVRGLKGTTEITGRVRVRGGEVGVAQEEEEEGREGEEEKWNELPFGTCHFNF